MKKLLRQKTTRIIGAPDKLQVGGASLVNGVCEQELNDKDYTRANTIPIEDYRKYPCVHGIPMLPVAKWSTEGRCVRTFCYTESQNKTNKNCVQLRTFRGTTPICTYPVENDIYVSASIHVYGQWEGSLVNQLARFFASKPEHEFIDLGCNIGAYSLTLAHQGVKVTAVDPMLENLELLSRSLKLGKLQKNVTLIWNAVSNKRYPITFKTAENNVGGTHIQDANVKNSKHYMARTVLLDDLLPLFRGKQVVIKMDIEGHEYRALLGGNRFFNEVDIVALQIEFRFHAKGPHGVKILDYFSSKGYHPFKDINKNYPFNSARSRKMAPRYLFFEDQANKQLFCTIEN